MSAPRTPTFDAARLPAILDAVADGIIVQAVDGTPVYANRAAARFLGFADAGAYLAAPPDRIFASLVLRDETGREVPREELPGAQVRAGAERASMVVRFEGRDDEGDRWAEVSAVAVRDEDGDVRQIVHVLRDISDRRRMEDDLAKEALERTRLAEAREGLLAQLESERTRLETVLQAIPLGVTVAEAPSGRVVFANAAAERILGTRPVSASPEDPGAFRAYHEDGRLFGPKDWPLAVTLATGAAVPSATIRFERADGTIGRLAASSVPVHDREGRLVAGVVVFDEVTRSEVAREQAEFLAEASGVLSGSLDADESVRRVARLAVPAIADWCAIEVADENGTMEVLALEHVDPARAEHLRVLRMRADAMGPRATASARVMASGTPELVSTIDRAHVDAAVPGDLREATAALGLASYICAPLTVGGRVIGTLTLATEGPGRRFGEADIGFAEVLAGRVATALETARLVADAARLHAVVDAIEDVVEMFDPRTLRITYVNDGMVRQLGRSRDELVRLTPCDITVGLAPHRLRELIQPLIDGSVSSRTVDIIRRGADGSPIPLEARWQYVELPGERARIVAVGRDIRDRLAAERRLADLADQEHARAAELNAIIRTIGEGLLVIDQERRVRLANPTARALFAADPPATLDDLAALLLLPEGSAPETLLEPEHPLELARRDGAGWLEVNAYPVDAEAVAGAGETILILRDVSAARERERVRDAFVGVLSHELRTPVTTIFAGAKVLARDSTTALGEAARAEIFEDIQSEAERLHRLVEDVVALTRFGEGALEIGKEPVLLQRILPSVARSEQARWPGGVFELELEGDLPPVAGDPTYVEQVVRNLLANAVKYGGGSPVRVVASHAGDDVEVRVIDGGPGFPPDEADRLFDLYYRSPSVAKQVSGSGLGLFVCARLIEAMGGRIWALKRPEGGAEFGFALRSMGEELEV